MSNLKKVPSSGQKGKISYNRSIVSAIVAIAVSQISGVSLYEHSGAFSHQRSGISVRFDKGGIFVDVAVCITYGNNVPDIAYKIQETIKHNVETMSEFKIANVDVYVCGVDFGQEEIPANL